MNNNELLKKYESTTTTDLNNQVKSAVEKANAYAKQPELNQVELLKLRADAVALADDYNRLVKLRRLGELAAMSYGDAINAMTGADGETCPKMELVLEGEIMNITTSNATRIRWNELLKAGQRPDGYENLESLVKVFTHNCLTNKFEKGQLVELPPLDPAIKAVANGRDNWNSSSMNKLQCQIRDLIGWMFPVDEVGEYSAPRKSDVRWFSDIVCPASDRAGEPAHYVQRKVSTLLDSLFRVFYTLKEEKEVVVRPAKAGKNQ